MCAELAREQRQERRLAGRVAIVTGAGQGIGEGIARAFAKHGASLVLVGRNRGKLDSVAAAIREIGGTVQLVQGSVAERSIADRAVAEAVSAFGRLDILVNNAHTFTPKAPLDQITEEYFRINLESGFFGTVHFMQAAFPHMREAGGSIINLGSLTGVLGQKTYAPYAATKEAIRGLSRTAARDWGEYRIRVNVLNPGADSPASLRYFAEHPDNLRRTLETMALGYRGTPEDDVAPIAVFLAGDDSRYMTGQTINADGGRVMF
jgi:NAD(P)-dependent dehydrogenase (short-subunit alcohol dehydrogenase family)